jgi:hypothetical protein
LTDQTSSLQENQSPDCLNVDFGIRKGFVLRGGFQHQVTDSQIPGARFLGPAHTGNSEYVMLHAADGSLLTWDGGTLVDTGVDVTDEDRRCRMEVFNNVAYIADGRSAGTQIMSKWDGSTLSALGTDWDENFVAPSGSNMPAGRFIAEWRGYMWVASTFEDGTAHPSRLRFSHLQFPESWSELDYFDVGDTESLLHPITTIIKFRDRLMVFKKDQVWQVTGNDPDDFQVTLVTSASGICTCGAADGNSGVLYWFSTDGRLMAFNGENISVLSEPIRYWSDIGKIQHGGSHRVMWADGKLWLSLQAGGAEMVDRWLFVWAPDTKTFTRYDREPTDMTFWPKIGSDADPLFVEGDDWHIYRYDAAYEFDSGAPHEWYGYPIQTNPDGSPILLPGYDESQIRIDGYFRTAWVTAGETATKKRWKPVANGWPKAGPIPGTTLRKTICAGWK